MSNRNNGIDLLKVIATIFVIYIHSLHNWITTTIARCAVPIFFIITGYFYQNVVNTERENQQILKILKLTISSNILYLLFNLYISEDPVSYFYNTFSATNLLLTIKYNNNTLGTQLWYLFALLYVLIIVKVFNRLNKFYILCNLTPILLIIDLVFGAYSVLIFGREYPTLYVRNYLFVGIPYFCIGYLINSYYDIIISKTTKPLLVIASIAFSLSTFLERYTLIYVDRLSLSREHYISSTLLGISLFLLFSQINTNTQIFKKIAKIGKDFSTSIFIIHIIVISFLSKVLPKLAPNYNMKNWTFPLIVFLVSIMCSKIFNVVFSTKR